MELKRDDQLELRRLKSLLAAFDQAHHALACGLREEDLLPAVCRLMAESGGFRLVAISEHESAARRVRWVARHGEDASYLDDITIVTDDRPEGRAPTAIAIREGRTCVCNDFFADPGMAPFHAAARRYGFSASAAFPIRRRGQTWGALSVYEARAGYFGDPETAILEHAASALSFALDMLDREKERLRALQSLAESEQRYRYLFENNPHSMWVYDLETLAILAVNDTAVQSYGYTRTELLGMSILDLHESEVARKIPPVVSQLPGTIRRPGVYRQRRKDGSALDADLTTHDMEFAGRPARLVLAVDVSAQVQAEALLRLNQERLARTQAAGHVGSWEFDPHTGRIWGSDEGFRMFGLPRANEEVPIEEIEACIPDAARVHQALVDLVNNGKAYDLEYTVRPADGRAPCIVRSVGEVIRDAEGRPMRVTGVVQDVTVRRKAQDALRRSEDRFRRLSGRLVSLREEERARISREIHDELGQLLTALRMDLRWVAHRIEACGEASRPHTILDRLTAATGLCDTAAASVQRIAADLRPGILDRLGLAEAIEYEARRFEERAGVSCRVFAAGESTVPPESSTALFRILQEALTNVARHAGATTVEIELRVAGDHHYLEVRDDGRGMRGGEEGDSTSLGLVGMQERARQLGGDVSFRPRPGGGTIVRAEIPDSPADEDSP